MERSQRQAKSMALYGISASAEGNDWAAAELSETAMRYYEELREASKRKKLQQMKRKAEREREEREKREGGGKEKESERKRENAKKRGKGKKGTMRGRETTTTTTTTNGAKNAKNSTKRKRESGGKTAKHKKRQKGNGNSSSLPVIDLENSDSDENVEEVIDISAPAVKKKTATKRKRSGSTGSAAKKKRATQSFRHILTNSYVDIEKPRETEIHECSCMLIEGVPEAACGSMNCMNRMVHVECHPTHCPCGEECQNQRFQRRSYASVNILQTEKKGQGLEAAEFIEEGQFVIEYVGEVISHDTCMDRLDACEKNFYVIALDNGVYVDASKKGNIARFMNHSCDPNCRTEKWQVRGHWRVGIFALTDIEKGTELTFDYQFQRVGKEKQRCYCGAANCRGFLGEKKKAPIPVKKTKEVVKKAKPSKPEVKQVGLPEVLDAMLHPPTDPLAHQRLVQRRRLFLSRNVRQVRDFHDDQ